MQKGKGSGARLKVQAELYYFCTFEGSCSVCELAIMLFEQGNKCQTTDVYKFPIDTPPTCAPTESPPTAGSI